MCIIFSWFTRNECAECTVVRTGEDTLINKTQKAPTNVSVQLDYYYNGCVHVLAAFGVIGSFYLKQMITQDTLHTDRNL